MYSEVIHTSLAMQKVLSRIRLKVRQEVALHCDLLKMMGVMDMVLSHSEISRK